MRRILCALIVILSASAVSAQQRFAPPKVTTLTGLNGNQGDIVNLVGTGDYLCSASTCTSASDWKQITSGGSTPGTGTVTSVGWTGGLVSVGTPTSTPAFTVVGTSGGIPYFSSTSTWASSGLLASGGVVYGGGAGAAPATNANLLFVATGLSTPADPTLTAHGGTGTTYCYVIAARNAVGTSIINDNACVSGPASLNNSGNNIDIATAAVTGSTDCVIYRNGGTLGIVTTTACGNTVTDIGTTLNAGDNTFYNGSLNYQNTSQGLAAAAHFRVPSSGDVALSDIAIGSPDASFSGAVSSYLISGLARIAYHGSTSNRVAGLDVVIESTSGAAPQALQAANFASGASGGSPRGLIGTAGTSDTSTAVEASGVSGQISVLSGGTVADGSGFRTLGGSGSSDVTALAGYTAENMTGGTNTYGFRGKIASGSGKFNIYADGTAPNYLAADLGLGNGAALKTTTTTAHTLLFQAYDVDGTAYKTFATLTNGNTPDFTITAPSGGTVTVAPTTLTIPSGTSLTGGTVTARLVTNGTTPTVADVGASSCGTTAATIAGNSNTGEITVGATAGTQCRITFPTAAAVRYNCTCSDSTTAALCRSTFVDTTHSDIFGAFTAGDVVEYICLPR